VTAAAELNARERTGRWMRRCCITLVGMPLTLLLLPLYLRHAWRGLPDRWALFSFASVTVSMVGLPFWILLLLALLR